MPELPGPLPGEDEGVPVGEGGVAVGVDDGEFVGDDGGEALVVLAAAFRLPLDPLASLIPLAVLLNTTVVAVPSAFMPATTVATSSSKRTAYSGPATPASSFAMRRNILAPEAARDVYRPRPLSPAGRRPCLVTLCQD